MKTFLCQVCPLESGEEQTPNSTAEDSVPAGAVALQTERAHCSKAVIMIMIMITLELIHRRRAYSWTLFLGTIVLSHLSAMLFQADVTEATP